MQFFGGIEEGIEGCIEEGRSAGGLMVSVGVIAGVRVL
jgi:hypothetical protein